MSKPDKHMKKGPYEREMARRRRERKRRIRRFHLICLGVMLLAFIIVCVNIFSHKKSIRKEAVSLYEAGNYQEALDKFKEAYAEKQWFSDSINVDILLYEADCMMQLQLFSDAELTYLDIQKNTRLPSMTRNSFPICPTCLMRLVIISAEIMFQLSRLSQRQWKTDIRISVSMQPSVMKTRKAMIR